jgi:hypothetical protein
MSSGFAWALGNVEVALQPNSLSRPPYLHYWALDSGKWRLRKITDEKVIKSCCGSSSRPDEAACLRYDGLVEHIVLENETIETICDHYACTIHSLIQCNEGLGLQFATLPKYIRVPVKTGFPVSKIQSTEREVLLRRFALDTDLTDDEASELLAAHEFDFVQAMTHWDPSHSWATSYLSSLTQTAPIYVTSYSRLHPSEGAADMNTATSALPPPPLGYDWKLLPNGEWELIQEIVSSPHSVEEEEEGDSNSSPTATGSFFVHRIRPSDTLQGLCLKYRVAQRAVMKLNHLSSTRIQFLTELRIPLRPDQITPPSPAEEETETEGEQSNAERDLIQTFAQETGLTQQGAKCYLQASDFSYQEALQEWRADEEWCRAQVGKGAVREVLEVDSY